MSVRLRDTLETDIELVLALEADPEAAPFIEAWPAERHRRALGDPDIAHLQLIEDGWRVGFAILAGLQDPNDCVELRRIVIGRPGRGHGRAAIALLLDYAWLVLGAHRVWLDVKPENRRARHLYSALGFEQEGILRDALRTEVGYEPLILMAKTAPAQPGAAKS